MKRVTFAGVLALTLLTLTPEATVGAGSAPAPPGIRAIRLANENRDVWVGTSGGLLRVESAGVPEDGVNLEQLVVDTGGEEPIAGRTDRPIDDVERLTWGTGRQANGELQETMIVTSEGAMWARSGDDNWVRLECDPDQQGNSCPTGPLHGLESTVVQAQDARTLDSGVLCAQQPERRELLAFGPEGIWRLTPSDPRTPRAPTEPSAWTWIALDAGAGAGAGAHERDPLDVVAAFQDRRGTRSGDSGRVWVVGAGSAGPELRIHDLYPVKDRVSCTPDPGPVVRRPLPEAPSASAHPTMTPDARGGMWIGLPGRVLWMNPEGAVRDDLDGCQVRLGRPTQDGGCTPPTDPFSVLSIDNNLDDIWVGSRDGLVRLSVGSSSDLVASKLDDHGPVSDMTRLRAGGDAWVATPDLLRRVEIDRWSFDEQDRLAGVPITALRAGGAQRAETVFIGTDGGLVLAKWDNSRSRLAFLPDVEAITGPIQSISQLTDAGAFVAADVGLWLVGDDGSSIELPDMAGSRVGAVEVVGDTVYIGTATGVSAAPLDEVMEPGAFQPVELVPADAAAGATVARADVTAIWELDGQPWFGTGGQGLLTVPGGRRTWCRPAQSGAPGPAVRPDDDPPLADAVVRSGSATGSESFVVVTSDGVYNAQPPADSTNGDSASCELRFRRRSAADANVAIPGGAFENIAMGPPGPDGTPSGEASHRQLVWAGSDRSLELVWWPDDAPATDDDGAPPSVLETLTEPVVSRFDSVTFLDASKVGALATVGSGDESTLVIGTDYGIYYHTPGRITPEFRIDTIRALDDTGAQVGDVVVCTDDDRRCISPSFDHEATTLEVQLGVGSVGDPNLYQFVVRNGSADPAVEGRTFSVPTGRGQTEKLAVTALGLHLNESGSKQYELHVEQRTPWQWFTETNAFWIALILGTALVAGLGGYSVVRFVRRRGRHRLRDVEVALQPAPDENSALVTVGQFSDLRIIDRSRVLKLWDTVRSDKDTAPVLEIGDALFDGLFSPNAARELRRVGLGTNDVRLRLRGLDAGLDALPWEALRTGSGSLIARSTTSVVRDLRALSDGSTEEAAATDEVTFPVRVLVVVARPERPAAGRRGRPRRSRRSRPPRRPGTAVGPRHGRRARARRAPSRCGPAVRSGDGLRLRPRHRPRRAQRPGLEDLARGRGR